MKKIGLIVGVLIVVCLLLAGVCFIHKLDINDYDPQFSSSIRDSKVNGFFILKYDTVKGDHNYVRIDEAWVENVWYNKATFLSQKKEKMKGFDFIIKIDTEQNNQLSKINDYDKWQFEIKSNKEIMGKEYSGNKIRNCHYILDSLVPDTIVILYKRRVNTNDTFRLVSQITLLKKP